MKGCRSGSGYIILLHSVQYLETNMVRRIRTAAAALNVTEPSSTGIGGDMFCLFYNAKTRKIHALNGSGRYATNATVQKIRQTLNIGPDEQGTIPMTSVHAVTTPGAAAGWVDTVKKFGSERLSLEQILMPAIELAEEGFPVSEFASSFVSPLKS
jgi:gamma-glutamyltranspeptidase / glutathione hydrolase